jgi:hypothetical protein
LFYFNVFGIVVSEAYYPDLEDIADKMYGINVYTIDFLSVPQVRRQSATDRRTPQDNHMMSIWSM